MKSKFVCFLLFCELKKNKMEVHCNLQNVADNMPLSSYDYIYHNQNKNPRTRITTVFLSENNLNWLNDQIGIETGQMLNRNVHVLPNNQFFEYLETTLRGVANLPNVYQSVDRLNRKILDHEVQVQYRSLRRRELFFKWFFFKDRPRVLSRAVLTNGRYRTDKFSNGNYALANPKKQQWENFKKQVYGH
jgi:hypothetical protein